MTAECWPVAHVQVSDRVQPCCSDAFQRAPCARFGSYAWSRRSRDQQCRALDRQQYAVVKHEFGGVRATPSVFVESSQPRSLRTRWDEEHGDAVAVFGAGSSRNDGHVSVHRVRDVGLGSVDLPSITITHRRGAHASHVAAGVRFEHTDRKDRLSRQHAGQPVIELLFRS